MTGLTQLSLAGWASRGAGDKTQSKGVLMKSQRPNSMQTTGRKSSAAPVAVKDAHLCGGQESMCLPPPKPGQERTFEPKEASGALPSENGCRRGAKSKLPNLSDSDKVLQKRSKPKLQNVDANPSATDKDEMSEGTYQCSARDNANQLIMSQQLLPFKRKAEADMPGVHSPRSQSKTDGSAQPSEQPAGSSHAIDSTWPPECEVASGTKNSPSRDDAQLMQAQSETAARSQEPSVKGASIPSSIDALPIEKANEFDSHTHAPLPGKRLPGNSAGAAMISAMVSAVDESALSTANTGHYSGGHTGQEHACSGDADLAVIQPSPEPACLRVARGNGSVRCGETATLLPRSRGVSYVDAGSNEVSARDDGSSAHAEAETQSCEGVCGDRLRLEGEIDGNATLGPEASIAAAAAEEEQGEEEGGVVQRDAEMKTATAAAAAAAAAAVAAAAGSESIGGESLTSLRRAQQGSGDVEAQSLEVERRAGARLAGQNGADANTVASTGDNAGAGPNSGFNTGSGAGIATGAAAGTMASSGAAAEETTGAGVGDGIGAGSYGVHSCSGLSEYEMQRLNNIRENEAGRACLTPLYPCSLSRAAPPLCLLTAADVQAGSL
eukprot:5175192-Pleurochrysis_carterae.AAC.9